MRECMYVCYRGNYWIVGWKAKGSKVTPEPKVCVWEGGGAPSAVQDSTTTGLLSQCFCIVAKCEVHDDPVKCKYDR